MIIKILLYLLAFIVAIAIIGFIAYSLRGRLKLTDPDSGVLQARLEQNQINPKALENLISAGKKTHSDAIVVYRNGELIGAWYSRGKARKIEAMSVTKSIVNLAIGLAITQGYIKSLDTPMYTFFPEWQDGQKSKITLRHILSHTSGLYTKGPAYDIYKTDDFVKYALKADLVNEPGTNFFYNNRAVNLLAAVIEKTTTKRMDIYLGEELFKPMGINDFSWTLDKAGNPHSMSGLQIIAEDLAKLGQLVLNKGSFKDKQLIDTSWFDLSLSPGAKFTPDHGLLWWIRRDTVHIIDDARIGELQEIGLSEETLNKLKTIKGEYHNGKDFLGAMKKAFGSSPGKIRTELASFGIMSPDRKEFGKINYYAADGYLGQYIYIDFDKQLVGVRMIGEHLLYNPMLDGFEDFADLMADLVD